MKASELRPGQFFEYVGKRYMALNGKSFGFNGRSRVYFISRDFVLCWAGNDAEVTPLAVTGWDDEPQSETQINATQTVLLECLKCLRGAESHGLEIQASDGVKLSDKIESVLAPVNPAPSTPEPQFTEQLFKACAAKVESFGVRTQEWVTPEPQPFQAGGLVVCVDDENSSPQLYKGYLYNVVKVLDVGVVYLDEHRHPWRSDRFRHATDAEIEQYRASKIANAVVNGCNELVDKLRQESMPDQDEQNRQDDEGWIEHDGVRRPVSSVADVQLRVQNRQGQIESRGIYDAGAVEWENAQRGEWKITHYRVVSAPEGWIEWTGGECPVDGDTVVDVRFADGDSGGPIEAKHLWWGRKTGNRPSHITHYRVVESEPAKYRPFASAAEFAPHKDRWIQDKNYKPFFTKISSFHDTAIWLASASTGIDWKHLFDKWQFDNGEPCGVRE